MGGLEFERLEDRLMLAGDFVWARQRADPEFGVQAVDPAGNLLISAPYGLQKWSPTGRRSWTWSRSVTPLDVTTDSAGNIYVAGSFVGERDLDPTRGRTVISTGRRTLPDEEVIGATDYESDAFVAKLNPAGRVIWAKSLPSSGFKDSALNVGLDGAGNVTVSGRFAGRAVFAHADGTRQVMRGRGVPRDHGMAQDAFLWRLDGRGNSLWARQLDLGVEEPRNTGDVPTHKMGVDAAGNVYLGGRFAGVVDFDPSKSGQTILRASHTIRDGADGAVVKLDADGDFVWARRTGGSVSELQTDDAGNAYVVGEPHEVSVMDAAWGSRRLFARDGSTFVFKVTPDGGLDWLGQTMASIMDASIAGGDGDIYLTGEYETGDDFDLGAGRLEMAARIGRDGGLSSDAFVWRLDPGGATKWVRNIGGHQRDVGFSVAAAPNEAVHVGGMFFGRADMDPGRQKTIFAVRYVNTGFGSIFGGGTIHVRDYGFMVKLRG